MLKKLGTLLLLCLVWILIFGVPVRAQSAIPWRALLAAWLNNANGDLVADNKINSLDWAKHRVGGNVTSPTSTPPAPFISNQRPCTTTIPLNVTTINGSSY